MKLNPENCTLVSEFIHQVYPDMEEGFSNGVDYDSIKLSEGCELFSNEFFETEFKKYINSKPWVAFRNERSKKLTETDWTQTNDIIMENETEWMEYRQALRDLPSTTEDPENLIWPEPPKVKINTSGSTTHTQLQVEKVKTQQMETDLQTEKVKTQQMETDLQAEKVKTQEIDADLQAEKVKTQQMEARLSLLESTLASLIS